MFQRGRQSKGDTIMKVINNDKVIRTSGVFTAVGGESWGERKNHLHGSLAIQVEWNLDGTLAFDFVILDYKDDSRAVWNKLPLLNKQTEFTCFQQRVSRLRELLTDTDEIVCGTYKVDLRPVLKFFNHLSGTALNPANDRFNLEAPINPLFDRIRRGTGKGYTIEKIAQEYNIPMVDVEEFALLLRNEFDVDLLDRCDIQASLWCLARLRQLGFDSSDVITALAAKVDAASEKELWDLETYKISVDRRVSKDENKIGIERFIHNL